jgi:hypothetical protein
MLADSFPQAWPIDGIGNLAGKGLGGPFQFTEGHGSLAVDYGDLSWGSLASFHDSSDQGIICRQVM